MSWTSERKAKRLTEVSGNIISEKAYNMVLGGVVFYGLFVNVILCALFGEKMADFLAGASKTGMIAITVGYIVLAMAGIAISHFSSNPAISFLGYNFVVVPMGLMVSALVTAYLDAGMGDIVFQAILYTAVITFVMIVLACAFPGFFSKIGGILCGCLIGLVIAEIVALLIFRTHQTIFSWIGAAIFSLYIGYDYWRAQQYPKTVDNAVDSAVDIYLDIINLFIRILSILANSRSND